MAHELTKINGHVGFAYIGQRAWHGLGNLMVEGASLEDWAKAGGLDFVATKAPVYMQIDGKFEQIQDRFAIFRPDNHECLAVLSGRYNIVQPASLVDFFRKFIITDPRFTIETMGSLKGGRVVWALARFHNDMSIVDEKHVPYVLLTTSFDGSLATTAQATMIRVVCNNTLTASVFSKRSANVRVCHSTVWSDSIASQAHDDLIAIAQDFDEYRSMAEHMARVKLTQTQTEEFLTRLIIKETDEEEKKSTRMQNQVAALLAAYDKTVDEGTEAGTGWAAMNAVTRYADHERQTRRTTANETTEGARMYSAFFGSGAQMKQQAAKLLKAYDPQTRTTVTIPASMRALIAA